MLGLVLGIDGGLFCILSGIIGLMVEIFCQDGSVVKGLFSDGNFTLSSTLLTTENVCSSPRVHICMNLSLRCSIEEAHEVSDHL